MEKDTKTEKITIGWREWVCLPELGITIIKAKTDTGARTSALHTFSQEVFEEDGQLKVRFGVHPEQGKTDKEIFCVADVIDRRMVKNTGGQPDERLVIRTPLQIGGATWPVEITLARRDSMRFRMLLGRTAMRGRILVNPGASYLTGKRKRKPNRKLTSEEM